MAKQRNPDSRSRRAHKAVLPERWGAAVIGIVAAFAALLIHFLAEGLADLFGADHWTVVYRVAQAVGLASVALGLLGLWRKENDIVCGIAIVLGTVAIFFQFFLFVLIAGAVIGVAVLLFRMFFRR